MSSIKIFAAVCCVAIVWATAASAQRWNRCDPRYYFITSENCTNAAKEFGKSVAQVREAIAEESINIATARKRFWDTYPDKPGAVQARDAFNKRLTGKDEYYLWVSLTDALGGVKTLDIVGGKLDGGIPRYASFEFRDWVEEIKSRLGERSLTNSLLMDPVGLSARVAKAMEASQKKHEIYLFERNWAEFDAVGREPAGLEDPAMYFQAICIRGQRIGWEEAHTEFDGITKALGKDNVLKASEQVHAAPRERFGVLKVTMPPPVKRAPGGAEVEDPDVPLPEGVIGVTASAIRAVERLAVQGDDRGHALWLLTDMNLRGSTLVHETKWQYAETAYQKLIMAFGEQDVLEASRLVRTATKRATSSDVMNPSAIGATRGVPLSSFQDVLARKNPRGYLRSALLVSENLDSPAAVDASYKTLVSAGGETAYLEAAKKLAAGRPNVLYGGELASIKDMMTSPPEPEKPAVALVDFPEYLAWKNFTAGAKVVHATRYWQMAGQNNFTAGPVNYLRTYQLQFINAERAKLWSGETFFDRSGRPKPPSEREEGYPAKFTPPPNALVNQPRHAQLLASFSAGSNLAMGAQPTSTPIETGEETIEVNGKRIATKWESASYQYDASVWTDQKNCRLVVKLWTSEAVPTGLVRKTEDKTCSPAGAGQAPRFMVETYLQSFEGFTPAVADATTK